MKLLLLLELEAIAGMWAWSVTVKRKKRLAAKTLPLLLLGLLTLNAVGQPKPKPLTCGKYQHVYHWVGQCGPSSCNPDAVSCVAICNSIPEDKCVDDMHEVTEREWQAILKRLDDLEFKASGKPAFTNGVKLNTTVSGGSGAISAGTISGEGFKSSATESVEVQAKSAIPAKPWKASECSKRVDYATREWISYCTKVSPNNYPVCQISDPREVMWAAQSSGGKGAYFEVLDCSWHGGEKNPRDAKREP